MTYFENMKKTTYSFPLFPEMEMQNIFSRVVFREDVARNNKNFKTYWVTEGKRPEQVAYEFYGNEKYWWLVLLSNNITDPLYEWPKSQKELGSYVSNFLKGNSYYVYEDLDIKQGDVIIKRDTSMDGDIDIENYGLIDNHNPFLHKIDVKIESGTLSQGDTFYVYRDISGDNTEWKLIYGFGETGCAPPYCGSTFCVPNDGPNCPDVGITYGQIRRKDNIKDSLNHFEYGSNEVDPYANDYMSGISCSNFAFQNICGLTNSIMYKYISNENFNNDIKNVSVLNYFIEENDRKRKIKLVVADLAPLIEQEMKTLFKENVPRGTLKYITLGTPTT